MTEQKPPGVSWGSWVDELLRRAREAGEFDQLAGAGQPIPGLSDGYDPDWWVKKMVRREQVSVLPPSLELLRTVEAELAAIWTLRSEMEVRARVASLNARIAKVNANVTEGPPTRLAPFDIDPIVAEWRRRSATTA